MSIYDFKAVRLFYRLGTQMKKTLLLLFAFLLSASTAYSTTVAFVDVNVIPMDKERVLSHQTFGVQPLGCSVREKAS